MLHRLNQIKIMKEHLKKSIELDQEEDKELGGMNMAYITLKETNEN